MFILFMVIMACVRGLMSDYHQENMSVKCIPLIPHFFIVKLGFAGVYLFFLFLLQNIDCGYSLEPPQRGGSNENRLSEAVLTCTHNLCSEQK